MLSRQGDLLSDSSYGITTVAKHFSIHLKSFSKERSLNRNELVIIMVDRKRRGALGENLSMDARDSLFCKSFKEDTFL